MMHSLAACRTNTTVGAATGPYFVSNTQTTDTVDLATNVSFSGSGVNDDLITVGQCPPAGVTVIVLAPGLFCYPEISFLPEAPGDAPPR
jgi:hypothetical protein